MFLNEESAQKVMQEDPLIHGILQLEIYQTDMKWSRRTSRAFHQQPWRKVASRAKSSMHTKPNKLLVNHSALKNPHTCECKSTILLKITSAIRNGTLLHWIPESQCTLCIEGPSRDREPRNLNFLLAAGDLPR